jgi:hypothetical protein
MSSQGWSWLEVREDNAVSANLADVAPTDYLHFAGWSEVEIVDLCARDESGSRVTDDHGTVLSTAKSGSVLSHIDPLWVVRATKST